AVALPLHDPSLQWLSPEDLASAVCSAVERSEGGIFNVAPDGVIPLRVALRMAGVMCIPVWRLLQRVPRHVLFTLGLASPIDQLEYLRYSWTISNQKIKQELGFTPERSSPEVLMDFLHGQARGRQNGLARRLAFDDFGMDTSYINAWGR